jgi:hypothetical protein
MFWPNHPVAKGSSSVLCASTSLASTTSGPYSEAIAARNSGSGRSKANRTVAASTTSIWAGSATKRAITLTGPWPIARNRVKESFTAWASQGVPSWKSAFGAMRNV